MLDYLPENIPVEAKPLIPAKSNFDWLDYEPKKKKGGKRRKKGKNHSQKYEYAKLAFRYGVLASRYDTLTRMVELAVAAKRQRLDDDLLSDGLEALGQRRFRCLPELEM